MGQVTFAINGRSYRIGCADGEEARLRQLAKEIAQRVDRLVMEFGQVGEARLLLMAALLATDELIDARTNLDVLVEEAAERLASVARDNAEAVRAATQPQISQPQVAQVYAAPPQVASPEPSNHVPAGDTSAATVVPSVTQAAEGERPAEASANSPVELPAAPPNTAKGAVLPRVVRPHRIEMPGKTRTA